MTQLLPNIFAQPLHPSEYRGEIIDGKLYLYHRAQLSDDVRSIVDLPPGSYEIMFTTKDCTEEQARTVPMEDAEKNFGYKDYEGKELSHFHVHPALHSLLKSKGLTAENYLIIKKFER